MLIFGNKTNLTVRPVLVTIIATLTIFTFLNMVPPANANPCTDNPCPDVIDYPIGSGTTTIYFRDINSMDNSSPSISLDHSSYRPGQTATLTINDFNENLNPFVPDAITATLEPSGTIVPLSENGGPDTGSFVGHFTVPNVFKGIDYPHEPQGLGRAKLTIDTPTGGDVLFSDYIFTPANSAGLPFTPLGQAVHFTLSGVTLGANAVSATMTWNNAVLDGVSPFDIQLCYQPDGGGWQEVTFSDNDYIGASLPDSFHDFISNTITDDNVNLGGPQITSSGLVVLCTNFGTTFGGGSVGIVSAGLQFNFLASIVPVAGNTVSPPSFGGTYNHYSDGLTFTQGTDTSTLDTSKYNQELPKQVMDTGKPVSMTFKTFESYKPTGVVHMGLYIIPRGQDMITSNSIGSIVWEKGKPIEVNDPNHILSDAAASSTDDGKFQYTKFSFTPEKSYDTMSFLIRAWNDHLYSTDIRVHDDITTSPILKTLPAGVVKYDNFADLQTALENDKFVKPQILAHIHSTTDVFSSTDSGHLYWLYDAINHTVTLVVADKNDNELYSYSTSLDPIAQDKKADYGFMQFTVPQLNRANEQQEKQAMDIEAAKAMFMALENGLMPHSKW